MNNKKNMINYKYLETIGYKQVLKGYMNYEYKYIGKYKYLFLIKYFLIKNDDIYIKKYNLYFDKEKINLYSYEDFGNFHNKNFSIFNINKLKLNLLSEYDECFKLLFKVKGIFINNIEIDIFNLKKFKINVKIKNEYNSENNKFKELIFFDFRLFLLYINYLNVIVKFTFNYNDIKFLYDKDINYFKNYIKEIY